MTTVRGEVSIIGDYANDASDTSVSFPIKVGGQAVDFDGTSPGVVAEGDRAHFKTDLQGAQLVNIGNPYGFFTAAASGGSTAGAAFVAGVAGMSIYITDVILSALTSCTITLREDTTTVTFLTVDFFGALAAAPNGGNISHSFRQPIKLATAKPLQFTATDKIKINVSGYYAP
jgi:hypothetical protein